MEYNDFVLRISPSNEPNRFTVNAKSATTGEATGAFVPPLSDAELKLFVLEMGLPRRGVRGISSPEWRAAEAFGEKLYQQLFSEEIQSIFLASRNEASRENKGLRVKFIIDAPALANYPWEFLFDPSLKQFLSLFEATPFVRYIELSVPPKVLRVAPPLRVLVVASSPTDYPPLDLAREKNNLDSAVAALVQQNQIEVDWLPNPNLEALRSQLQKRSYHIFHFIGHGGFDDATQDGVLVFEDEAKHSRMVSGEQLAYLLGNHPSLQLAVLNACEGARTSVQDPFAGTAMTLVRSGGVTAVIAMQFEITDEASIQFARGFYEGVALGRPIDGAVTEARLAVFAQGNYIEWATPVLYLRAPDGVIFEPLAREESQAASGVPEKTEGEPMGREQAERERVPQMQERKPPAPSVLSETSANKAGTQPRASTLAWAKEHLLQLGLVIVGVFALMVFILNAFILAPNALLNSPTPTQVSLATPNKSSPAATALTTVNPSSVNPSSTNASTRTASPTPTPIPGIGSTRVSSIDGATMMFVPAGDFLMGSSDSDIAYALKLCGVSSCGFLSNEQPQHTVTLDAFWMDKFEVTNALYKKCVDAGKCQPPNPITSTTRSSYYGNSQFDNYPVIYVSWNDASAYCTWAGKHLPSEAQWEKAARGPSTSSGDGRIFPWGNTFDKNLLNSSDGGKGDTTAVGSYPSGASPYGVMDLAGNVWEWVNDWYSTTYYSSSPRNNPTGPTSGQLRVLRGGMWGNGALNVRAAGRVGGNPSDRIASFGFRCAD